MDTYRLLQISCFLVALAVATASTKKTLAFMKHQKILSKTQEPFHSMGDISGIFPLLRPSTTTQNTPKPLFSKFLRVSATPSMDSTHMTAPSRQESHTRQIQPPLNAALPFTYVRSADKLRLNFNAEHGDEEKFVHSTRYGYAFGF